MITRLIQGLLFSFCCAGYLIGMDGQSDNRARQVEVHGVQYTVTDNTDLSNLLSFPRSPFLFGTYRSFPNSSNIRGPLKPVDFFVSGDSGYQKKQFFQDQKGTQYMRKLDDRCSQINELFYAWIAHNNGIPSQKVVRYKDAILIERLPGKTVYEQMVCDNKRSVYSDFLNQNKNVEWYVLRNNLRHLLRPDVVFGHEKLTTLFDIKALDIFLGALDRHNDNVMYNRGFFAIDNEMLFNSRLELNKELSSLDIPELADSHEYLVYSYFKNRLQKLADRYSEKDLVQMYQTICKDPKDLEWAQKRIAEQRACVPYVLADLDRILKHNAHLAPKEVDQFAIHESKKGFSKYLFNELGVT